MSQLILCAKIPPLRGNYENILTRRKSDYVTSAFRNRPYSTIVRETGRDHALSDVVEMNILACRLCAAITVSDAFIGGGRLKQPQAIGRSVQWSRFLRPLMHEFICLFSSSARSILSDCASASWLSSMLSCLWLMVLRWSYPQKTSCQNGRRSVG